MKSNLGYHSPFPGTLHRLWATPQRRAGTTNISFFCCVSRQFACLGDSQRISGWLFGAAGGGRVTSVGWIKMLRVESRDAVERNERKWSRKRIEAEKRERGYSLEWANQNREKVGGECHPRVEFGRRGCSCLLSCLSTHPPAPTRCVPHWFHVFSRFFIILPTSFAVCRLDFFFTSFPSLFSRTNPRMWRIDLK